MKTDQEFAFMLADFKDAPAVRLQVTRRKGHAEVEQGDSAILETMINPVVLMSGVRIHLDDSSFP